MIDLNKIEFVHHKTATIRRHYVTEDDIKIVLSRLPQDLWQRLKKFILKMMPEAIAYWAIQLPEVGERLVFVRYLSALASTE